MNLDKIRENIDGIDTEITQLFLKRMDLAREVAEFKKEKELPVVNKKREAEILKRISAMAKEPLDRYARILFGTLFDVSKAYQNSILIKESDLRAKIKEALDKTPKLFPEKAVVACQGVAGANSQTAAEKLFKFPSIMYFNSFEAIFNAVDKGLCDYGILPIENSSFGSVGHVYDLMKDKSFSIVKSAKVQISHKLLAKPGTKLSDIKEIISHQQAIGQCADFLDGLKDVKINNYPNTAMAAEAVAKSDRNDIAAISSKNCAHLYGLEVIEEDIQLTENNYTRFICISKNLEVYPGASKISLMLGISHEPQALYKLIGKISSLDLNLTKLESRPVPGSDFEFMFYFDIEASLQSKEVVDLLCQLKESQETFVLLGNYSEI